MVITEVAQLSGAALDWAVAVCQGLPVKDDPMGFITGAQSGFWLWPEDNHGCKLIGKTYSPSTLWVQGGLIMEESCIFPSEYKGRAKMNPNKFQAGEGVCWAGGETPLIAVMRSYVMSRLGQEIHVPKRLAPTP
jgi:hypothetical protein